MNEQWCYVVERIEWDEDLDGSNEYWEDRRVICVCLDREEAKKQAEENASGSDYGCRWLAKGLYAGSYEDHGMRYGIRYEIHRVVLY